MKVLKVTIRRKAAPAKGYLYPDFDSLQVIKDSGYVESSPGEKDAWKFWSSDNCSRPMYDSTGNHQDASVESPFGIWHGMMFVPPNFADQAVAALGDCVILNEAAAKDFYENKNMPYAEVDHPKKTWDSAKAGFTLTFAE